MIYPRAELDAIPGGYIATIYIHDDTLSKPYSSPLVTSSLKAALDYIQQYCIEGVSQDFHNHYQFSGENLDAAPASDSPGEMCFGAERRNVSEG